MKQRSHQERAHLSDGGLRRGIAKEMQRRFASLSDLFSLSILPTVSLANYEKYGARPRVAISQLKAAVKLKSTLENVMRCTQKSGDYSIFLVRRKTSEVNLTFFR